VKPPSAQTDEPIYEKEVEEMEIDAGCQEVE